MPVSQRRWKTTSLVPLVHSSCNPSQMTSTGGLSLTLERQRKPIIPDLTIINQIVEILLSDAYYDLVVHFIVAVNYLFSNRLDIWNRWTHDALCMFVPIFMFFMNCLMGLPLQANLPTGTNEAT